MKINKIQRNAYVQVLHKLKLHACTLSYIQLKHKPDNYTNNVPPENYFCEDCNLRVNSQTASRSLK